MKGIEWHNNKAQDDQDGGIHNSDPSGFAMEEMAQPGQPREVPKRREKPSPVPEPLPVTPPQPAPKPLEPSVPEPVEPTEPRREKEPA